MQKLLAWYEANVEHSAIMRLLDRYLSYGTADKSPPMRRRIRTINLACLIGASFGFGLTPIYIIYDFAGLWPFVCTGTVGPALTAALPLLHRKDTTLVPVGAYAIWLPLLAFASYSAGAGGGFHLMLLFFAVAGPLILGVENRRLVGILSFLSFGIFMTAALFFIEPSGLVRIDATLNFITTLAVGTCTIILIFAIVFSSSRSALLSEEALQSEFERSEHLLAALLPDSIAQTLKQRPGERIAQAHNDVVILFADIVDFTHRAAREPADVIVKTLDDLFRDMDALAERHNMEKIKTIGDAYMAVAGLSDTAADPIAAGVNMANEIHQICAAHGVEMRIGLHSGFVIAGVVGRQKPHFDVWSEAVNIAAAMEANSAAGRTLITSAVKDQLSAGFIGRPHAQISAKGAGHLAAYWLEKA